MTKENLISKSVAGPMGGRVGGRGYGWIKPKQILPCNSRSLFKMDIAHRKAQRKSHLSPLSTMEKIYPVYQVPINAMHNARKGLYGLCRQTLRSASAFSLCCLLKELLDTVAFCVEVLRPSTLLGHVKRSVYLTTRLLGRLSPLSG